LIAIAPTSQRNAKRKPSFAKLGLAILTGWIVTAMGARAS
jgi:hypothetical protein